MKNVDTSLYYFSVLCHDNVPSSSRCSNTMKVNKSLLHRFARAGAKTVWVSTVKCLSWNRQRDHTEVLHAWRGWPDSQQPIDRGLMSLSGATEISTGGTTYSTFGRGLRLVAALCSSLHRFPAKKAPRATNKHNTHLTTCTWNKRAMHCVIGRVGLPSKCFSSRGSQCALLSYGSKMYW